MAAKSTKLTYEEYKHLEGRLADFEEVTERTADEDAYRKTIILILAGRELRFVGPWVTYALKKAEMEAK
jgi:hypothetical protein